MSVVTESTPNPPGDPRFIEVGIGIVVRSIPDHTANINAPEAHEYQILITRRPAHTVYGGWWELPGGKIEPDEAVDDCVRRELLEEVGVEVEIVGALAEVLHTYDYGTVRLHPRVCRMTEGSPSPRPLHVDTFKWSSVEEIEDHKFLPANDALMRLLCEWMNGSGG